MNIFGIGLPEMALIFIVALLVFGPKKLPEIGRSLGKAIRGFQDASKEFENEFKREAQEIEKSVQMKATIEPPQRKALQSDAVPSDEEADKAAEPTAETVATESQADTTEEVAATPSEQPSNT